MQRDFTNLDPADNRAILTLVDDVKKPFLNVLVLCLLLPVVAAMAQTVVHSFDGDAGPGEAVCKPSPSHCSWPDMSAAVSPNQVVEATWQNVRVYDHSGHLLRSTPMGTFSATPV